MQQSASLQFLWSTAAQIGTLPGMLWGATEVGGLGVCPGDKNPASEGSCVRKVFKPVKKWTHYLRTWLWLYVFCVKCSRNIAFPLLLIRDPPAAGDLLCKRLWTHCFRSKSISRPSPAAPLSFVVSDFTKSKGALWADMPL